MERKSDDSSFSIGRTLVLSLMLHGGAFLGLQYISERPSPPPPVVVDLTLMVPPAGGGGASGRGGGSAGGGGTFSTPVDKPAPEAAPLPVGRLRQMPEARARDQERAERGAAKIAPAVQPLPSPERSRNAPAGATQAASAPPQAGVTGGGTATQGEGRGEGSGGGTGAGSGTGSGSGSGAGSGSGSGNGGGSGGGLERQRARYLAEQFAYIRDIIHRQLVYPKRARREGLSGVVRVSFVIQENGAVDSVRILGSSGYEILDTSAVEAIRRAAPFPRPPVRAELRMPIFYRLDR